MDDSIKRIYVPDLINVNPNLDLNDEEVLKIEKTIQGLREIPQPVQRTPEWYQFRWNLITASNAYKALDTQSSINQLIYRMLDASKIFYFCSVFLFINHDT